MLESNKGDGSMKGYIRVIRAGKLDEQMVLNAPMKLRLLQDIAGGDVEQLPHWSTYEGIACVVFANTDANRLRLPINKAAEEEWHYARIRDGVKGKSPSENPLRGPVIIVSGDDEFMQTL